MMNAFNDSQVNRGKLNPRRWIIVSVIGLLLAAALIVGYLSWFSPGKENRKKVVLDVDAISDVPTGAQAEIIDSENSTVRLVLQASISRFLEQAKSLQANGYSAVDVEFLEIENETFVSGIFDKPRLPESQPSSLYLGLNETELVQTRKKHQQAGQLLIDFERYQVGSEVRFAAIFSARENNDVYELKRGMSEQDLKDFLSKSNQPIVDFDANLQDGEMRYSVIVAKSDSDQANSMIVEHGLNMSELETVDGRLRVQGHFNYQLQPYNLPDSDVRFSGIWYAKGNPSHLANSIRRSLLDLVSLLETNRGLDRRGYRLVDIGTAFIDEDIIFTAVWHRFKPPPDPK